MTGWKPIVPTEIEPQRARRRIFRQGSVTGRRLARHDRLESYRTYKKTVERRPVARLNLIHFSTNLVCHPDIMSGLTVNKLHSVTRYEVTPTERQTEDVLVEPFLL